MLRKIRLLLYHFHLFPELVRVHQQIKQLDPDTQLFCFFPFYQTGGSEQVHADILEAVGTRYRRNQVAVFFTKPSRNNTFREVFNSAGQCVEIDAINRSAYRRFLIRILSSRINKVARPIVFGANATFAYELIPFLKTDVKFVDLTHSFVPESMAPVERFSLPYVPRLSVRVVINQKVLADYKELYAGAGLDWAQWQKQFRVVNNRLSYPYWDLVQKNYDPTPLRILFVGRNSPEKQIGLIGELAYRLRNHPIRFTLVGPELESTIQEAHRPFLSFAGEITGRKTLADLYKENHVILITSNREGFPLVLIEGMAHGCVPVSTLVGGIAYHVRHEQNGLLVENYTDKASVTEAMALHLITLLENPGYLRTLSQAAQQEAYHSFAPETFDQAWNEILSVQTTL